METTESLNQIGIRAECFLLGFEYAVFEWKADVVGDGLDAAHARAEIKLPKLSN